MGNFSRPNKLSDGSLPTSAASPSQMYRMSTRMLRAQGRTSEILEVQQNLKDLRLANWPCQFASTLKSIGGRNVRSTTNLAYAQRAVMSAMMNTTNCIPTVIQSCAVINSYSSWMPRKDARADCMRGNTKQCPRCRPRLTLMQPGERRRIMSIGRAVGVRDCHAQTR